LIVDSWKLTVEELSEKAQELSEKAQEYDVRLKWRLFL